MSIIGDFNSFNLELKNFITGFIILIPFWYLDIYLFGNGFFTSAPFYISIVLAFCLSICWVGLNLLMVLLYFNNKISHLPVPNFVTLVFGWALLFVALATVAAWYYKFTFVQFLKWSFIPLLVWIFVLFIKFIYHEMKDNARVKKTQQPG